MAETFRMPEARYKLLRIGERDFLDIASGKVVITDITPDHVLLGVFTDYYSNSFLLKIYHPDFPIVPEGMQMEHMHATLKRTEG